ncbi:MAG: protein kinase [Acidobacteriia bacterium]|nr:protein kinase [Terriglobia bacterium]
MPLSSGEQLGHYKIVSMIGKGGMGEVYLGTDTRLDRSVAIKVSAREFNDRFEREARAISALNHPNICTLHDVGPNYLVMEYIEGETLSKIIERGPLPLDKALSYAVQIVDALAAAHAKGVIHRDLKPGNIIITKNGAKVLDFGLAKVSTEKISPESAANIQTVTEPITRAGAILGTLYYMSPEQVEGKDSDGRSDIFSFGVVLYEMVTGQRPFTGDTQAAVLAALLKDQPAPMSQRQPATPRALERVVRKCLEKKPDDRWHSARDLTPTLELIDLEAPPTSMSSASTSVPIPVQTPHKKWLWPAVAATALVLLAGGGYQWWSAHRFTDLPLIRTDVNLGDDIALAGPVTFVTNFVISPDATRIAYIARPTAGGPFKLYTRRLDQPKAIELPGTENPRGPFFSPDGHWLGFGSASSRKLFKISVDGGAVVPLMDLAGVFQGASWGQDSKGESVIVVAQGGKPLVRIADNGGGQPASLGPFAPGEIIQVSPRLLPGGKAVLFAGNTGNEGGPSDPDRGSIEGISLADHQRKTILKGAASPRYVASRGGAGHLLYTFKGAVYAVPFDPDRLETQGSAVPILSDAQISPTTRAKYDVSLTGTLIYQKGSGAAGEGALSTVQWIDPSGKMEPLLAKPGTYSDVRVSPDGKRLAMTVGDGAKQDIQVLEWQSGRTTSLTFGTTAYADPVWTPDGQSVIFAASDGNLYSARADGSGQPQVLVKGEATAPRIPWSFSPDGKRLAFMQRVAGVYQLWTLPIGQEGSVLRAGMPEQFLKSTATDIMPQFSPDGKWLAYRSNVSGTDQVYVRPASGQGGQWIVSTQAATAPLWSRNGQDLLYETTDGPVMAVHYSAKGDAFVADKPRVWLAKFTGSSGDLSADGKRLVAIVPEHAAAAPQVEHEVVFLQNFFDELRRKVPTGK